MAGKMKTYVALLRGINVGGKNVIPMADLRKCLESTGVRDVSTYIQSGNVLLRSTIGTNKRLVAKLESALSKAFSYSARAVVVEKDEYCQMVAAAHNGWGEKADQKHNAMFLVDQLDAAEFLADLPEPRKGVDTVSTAKSVIFWSAKQAKIAQSSMLKVAKAKEYKMMTVRNHKTTRKLIELFENYN